MVDEVNVNMENKEYAERQEGRNNAEKVRLPRGGLEMELYSQGVRDYAQGKLNYGGKENGK